MSVLSIVTSTCIQLCKSLSSIPRPQFPSDTTEEGADPWGQPSTFKLFARKNTGCTNTKQCSQRGVSGPCAPPHWNCPWSVHIQTDETRGGRISAGSCLFAVSLFAVSSSPTFLFLGFAVSRGAVQTFGGSRSESDRRWLFHLLFLLLLMKMKQKCMKHRHVFVSAMSK